MKAAYRNLLVAVVIVLLLASLLLPAITGALTRGQMSDSLREAKDYHLMVQQMALDATTTGDTMATGCPADMGVKTVTELERRLVKGNYISAQDFEKLRAEKFQFGNVSEADAGDTILLRNGEIVFFKDGTGTIVPRGKNLLGHDPPRTPAYLAP